MKTIEQVKNFDDKKFQKTFDIIRLVEDTLLADERFHLPFKRALLKENIDIAVVDSTECSIQRPKKNKENAIPAKRNVIP